MSKKKTTAFLFLGGSLYFETQPPHLSKETNSNLFTAKPLRWTSTAVAVLFKRFSKKQRNLHELTQMGPGNMEDLLFGISLAPKASHQGHFQVWVLEVWWLSTGRGIYRLSLKLVV